MAVAIRSKETFGSAFVDGTYTFCRIHLYIDGNAI